MRPAPDDLIFLFGAGASAAASIPMSGQMIDNLEAGFVKTPGTAHEAWLKYERLYRHVKSSILFARGLEVSAQAADFNIESLVNTLTELGRHIGHPLYPFIATWNQRFLDLAGGPGFGEVSEFKKAVVRALQKWILVDRLKEKSSYMDGLVNLRNSLEHPLRIFSLNYDRCVETLESLQPKFHIEQGFGEQSSTVKTWDYRLMASDLERRDTIEVPDADVFLYKLHGSIDWKRGDEESVIWVPDTNKVMEIDPEFLHIIFGREAKMDARDPFAFFFSEFRRASKAASLIIAIGYSFSDPHINQIVCGALRDKNKPKRLLCIVGPPHVGTNIIIPADKLSQLRNEKETKDRLEIAKKLVGPISER